MKETTVTFSRLVDKFISWLEASDFDKPFLQPPAEVTAEQAPDPQCAEAPGQASAGTSFRESDLMVAITDMNKHIGSLEKLKLRVLRIPVETCCERLKTCLCSGDFTNEEIQDMLKSLDPLAMDSRLSTGQRHKIDGLIQSTVISAIAAIRRGDHSKLYDDAWASIVDVVFSMEPGVRKFRIFRYMMHEASPADIASIEDSEFAQMVQQFVCSHGDAAFTKGAVPSAWSKRARLFSRAVDRLPEARFEAMIPGIEDEILNQGGTRQRWLTWHLIRAYQSHSKTDAMVEMMANFRQQNPHQPMSSYEVRALSTARLVSEGFLDWPAAFEMDMVTYSHHTLAWTAFTDAVLGKGGVDSLKSLMTWLERTHEEPLLLGSVVFTLLNPETKQMGLVARRVMQRMIEDSVVDPRRFLAAVNLVAATLLDHAPHPKFAGKMRSREQVARELLQVTEWISHWYIRNPHLTDRQALRGVEWCIRISEKPNPDRKGSSKILVMLSKLVVRDLERGELGRTTRLKWLIAKIEEYHGTRAAKAALKTLEGWRWMVINQRRRQGHDI